jgi:hypothetical protein
VTQADDTDVAPPVLETSGYGRPGGAGSTPSVISNTIWSVLVFMP